MIYLSFMWMIFFFFTGLLLMFLPGRVTKSLSLFPFMFDFALTALPQTVWSDLSTGPRIFLLPLPVPVLTFGLNFFLFFILLAFLNFLEFDSRELKPPFRKRRPRK